LALAYGATDRSPAEVAALDDDALDAVLLAEAVGLVPEPVENSRLRTNIDRDRRRAF
jgi:hypothetical protein